MNDPSSSSLEPIQQPLSNSAAVGDDSSLYAESLYQPSSRYLQSAEFAQASVYGGSPHNFINAHAPVLVPGDWPPGRPLRVAHINTALMAAGIENWLASLAKFACPSRLRFTRCLVLGPWVQAKQVRRMGMPVTVGGGRASVAAVAGDCDLLLISDPGAEARQVAGWIAPHRPRLTIFVAHGDGSFTRDRLEAVRAVTDHVVAVSPHVQRTVVGDARSSVILNGVDPQRLVQTRPRPVNRERLGYGDGDFVVGFIGRFSEEKNPALVIDAVASLPPHCKLLIVGHGAQRGELIERCIRLLPSRFTMIDGSALENIGDLYNAMDALVMPSRLEGYGLVAMEAMMCGVPTITTDIGFAIDLIQHRINGLIVQPQPASIASAIRDLMMQPMFAQAIGQAGLATARRYGYASEMALRYEQLIASLWMSTSSSR